MRDFVETEGGFYSVLLVLAVIVVGILTGGAVSHAYITRDKPTVNQCKCNLTPETPKTAGGCCK